MNQEQPQPSADFKAQVRTANNAIGSTCASLLLAGVEHPVVVGQLILALAQLLAARPEDCFAGDLELVQQQLGSSARELRALKLDSTGAAHAH
jgi:hypothetical protein